MFLLEFCAASAKIWKFVGLIINILKIAIPIIIVLFATLDLGKAVIAGKDDEIKAAQKMLIKRLIYGVLIFFVVTIVQVIISLVTDAQNSSSDVYNTSNICWQCAVSPNGGTCKSAVADAAAK